jgi:hypothetical protein
MCLIQRCAAGGDLFKVSFRFVDPGVVAPAPALDASDETQVAFLIRRVQPSPRDTPFTSHCACFPTYGVCVAIAASAL